MVLQRWPLVTKIWGVGLGLSLRDEEGRVDATTSMVVLQQRTVISLIIDWYIVYIRYLIHLGDSPDYKYGISPARNEIRVKFIYDSLNTTQHNILRAQNKKLYSENISKSMIYD